MRVFKFFILILIFISCKESKKVISPEDKRVQFIDSLKNIYRYKIDLDLDTILGYNNLGDLNTIFFQKLDSNKICFSSKFRIVDIEKIDSVYYNVKLFYSFNQNILISLKTRNKNLISDFSRMDDVFVILKIDNKSFKSNFVYDVEGYPLKEINGSGDLITYFKYHN